jgi:acyl-CoA dehydrogenase
MSAGELLEVILRERPAPVAADEFALFWAGSEGVRSRFSLPFDRAVVGGFVSDRLGFAFASGYQAALRALVPLLPPNGLASFCVTEEGGNHPRAIHTRLERTGSGVVVTGVKRWCIAAATTFVVIATDATAATEAKVDNARPKLCAVRVDAGTSGVTLSPLPPTPFVPEVLHGELRLDCVRLGENAILPGDGYDGYTKPFRTVEDLHVQAALLGYLSSVGARSRWPGEIRERLAALIVTGRGLAALEPGRPETHVALSGFLAETTALATDADPHWALCDAAERERWYRDRTLVQVASKARATRRERAWQRLASEKI